MITASCANALGGIQDTALRLEFANGVCSGTAVGANVLLSAEHCWADGNRLIKINGAEAHALKIERDGADHVLVRVTTRFTRYARMGPEPLQGDRVRWVGNPASLNHQFRIGYVTGTDEGMTLIDATVFGGDSGSGLIDDKGRLVGVVSAMRRWETRSGVSLQLMAAYSLKFTPEQWDSIR